MNHSYFNTKKGFYWSDLNDKSLREGIIRYDLDIPTIRSHCFADKKTEMELELRTCLLFNAKDIKNITDKEVKEFKKKYTANNGK